MKKIIIVGIAFLVALVGVYFFLNVDNGDDMNYEKIPLKQFTDLSQEQLQKVTAKRIWFGHQSVGFNIVKGLEELTAAHETLGLRVVESRGLEGNEAPVFAHARVGENTKPKSKVDDFVRAVEEGLKDRVDIASFKFCYADITRHTNVERVFEYYKDQLAKLEAKYPDITFVHFTVPLYRKSGGVKGVLKGLLNRDHNVKRCRFNDMMREHYKGNELFDLAKYESTYPDGRRERGDKSRFALAPVYTRDGGHLNEKGREAMAVQLLHFLANL